MFFLRGMMGIKDSSVVAPMKDQDSTFDYLVHENDDWVNISSSEEENNIFGKEDLVDYNMKLEEFLVEINATIKNNWYGGDRNLHVKEESGRDYGLNLPLDDILTGSSVYKCPLFSNITILNNRIRTESISEVDVLKKLVSILQSEHIDYSYTPQNYNFKCIAYLNFEQVHFNLQIFRQFNNTIIIEFMRYFGSAIAAYSIFTKIQTLYTTSNNNTSPPPPPQQQLLISDASTTEKMLFNIIHSIKYHDEDDLLQNNLLLIVQITNQRDQQPALIQYLLKMEIIHILSSFLISYKQQWRSLEVQRLSLIGLIHLIDYIPMDKYKESLLEAIESNILENSGVIGTLRGVELKRLAEELVILLDRK